MYREQRLKKILALVAEQGELSAQRAMEELKVSRDTVRRDFSLLERQQKVTRTHGGILPLVDQSPIPAFKERINRLTKEKKQMAELASTFLQKGGHYFFDVSTSLLHLAQLTDLPITVYSHSLDNALVFSENEQVDFHLLGGRFYAENRFYFSLKEAELLESVNLDIAFIGAAGLRQGEVTFSEAEDVVVKALALKRARTKVLIAEIDKWDCQAPHVLCRLTAFDYLICDREPPKELLESVGRQTEIIY
ncbi:DeoR/GlpR transcriptional regulator [Streptococcus chenjunshii]|uniref:DeoR/GlpR transcriptional regulator n=1 Tax=Streptococcus chenjunshii TaxID=2173853 RepID=A0A372KK18_9STRE|nr:DeoR/GlpR family DNA-binding transcription regulator [Streptococcus chenjunshii]AXQ78939.1 DeoR/GlpR transcriptional regulator [Streptococcus chenjunshii]RFU50390.1 DeoR/GlpR transcriptional regulator [Streptococcus chenjunshii]RFU52619.1 DeoR/GlpR transcriptional regulator [Streptococcus chenjunshii]